MRYIAYYSNHFAKRSGTGIARYARELVNALSEFDESVKVVPVATWSDGDKDYINELKAGTGLRFLPTGRWITPLLWFSIEYPNLENLLDIPIDVVHANYLGYIVPTSKPYVITVHDIIPLTHPEYSKSNSAWFMEKHLKQALEKASAFICVSHATANSLIDYARRSYSADLSDRAYVVHEGIADEYFLTSDVSVDRNSCPGISHPFILAVGKISPRKNLGAIISALHKLQSTIPHHLVTVGGSGWDYKGVMQLVDSLGMSERVHFLGYVSDETLITLYNNAALFVYPSLLEGFGLPVLEAMASGCPVVTSSVSSLPEVAGNAAMLVDPLNIDEIAAVIEAICTDQMLASELRWKGKQRAAQFSWQKCARETLAIYDRIMPESTK